jgi:hypothetical protein
VLRNYTIFYVCDACPRNCATCKFEEQYVEETGKINKKVTALYYAHDRISWSITNIKMLPELLQANKHQNNLF